MTQSSSNPFSTIVIGNEALLIQCSEMLLQNGHDIRAVVSDRAEIMDWAHSKGLRVIANGSGLADRLQGLSCDWLFSIANLRIIPDAVLSLASKGAINFHDGPLPDYAGLNAPVWALINQEKRHGITWHIIEGGVDKGDILEQRVFDISAHETALTLNTKCFEAAIDSFSNLLSVLEGDTITRTKQDLSNRRYFGRDMRPKAAGLLDFSCSGEVLLALIHGLDHGNYWNPLYCPKIKLGAHVLRIGSATLSKLTTDQSAGTVLSVTDGTLVVATKTAPISLHKFSDLSGNSVALDGLVQAGDVLSSLTMETTKVLTGHMASIVKAETYWRGRLQSYIPASLPKKGVIFTDAKYTEHDLNLPNTLHDDALLAAVASWIARAGGQSEFDLAYCDETTCLDPVFCSDWVPVRFDANANYKAASDQFISNLEKAHSMRTFARDIIARDPKIDSGIKPEIGILVGDISKRIPKAGLTIAIADDTARLHYDINRFSKTEIAQFASQLELLTATVAQGKSDDTAVDRLPILTEAARDQVLYDWNDTKADYDCNKCIHEMFEAQVLRTPKAEALVFEGQSLCYDELNAQANRVAAVLVEMGVASGTLVGLFTKRSLDMVIAALAIQKAGGAYVPMDPNYPANRIAHFINDSAAPVIITQSDLVDTLPEHSASVLIIDTDPRIAAAPCENINSHVSPKDLAYLIYTSGSTGSPKGVMVEHRNVANFFAGMDQRIEHDPSGVWLAVTSLSFDISVLELFYTLARGFKVVLNSDESRVMVSGGQVAVSDQKMAFSLYNWGNDDFVGNNKYELLLEGAKFADKNGFCAVWTPERHFHAFGGLYPNPSVTGAAIAAVTKNLAVRAGSIVAPLHHPIRIAEEWAVIDNLTNGRVGLAIASGWQPNDFVLRPENTPPENKPAMFEAIKIIRKLWAGEAVDFPTKSGEPFGVVTHPRPLSKKLPVWVTTAGNPATWKEAGAVGANVLTHLLGQSIDEVKEKIVLYHTALREAGYDPKDFTVTLMLHTLVGDNREDTRKMAREPMKSYLRSAAGLIKQYAWAFPAFKRPKNVNNAFELDLGCLSEDELESILDFAFERYFEDAGLFGTVEDCLKRVEELKAIGVDEVACLVDYGLSVENVLAGLKPLAEVLKRANMATELDDNDYSIAAQITRHKVTHLQCTPSMARMLCADEHAKLAMGKIKHLMIGGEPLSGTLVSEFKAITPAHIENMYGPTETTIWSSCEHVDASVDGLVNIGTPIANTQMYVLDKHLEPVAVGVAGELFIGGAGVARGYWQRNDLTTERFLPDPFMPKGRMYRTGDLVRRREDGKIDFLGRVDNQVKLRGHRIELGEIEASLEAHTKVKQAVVVTRDITDGDTRLVAYMLVNSPVDNTELRKLLTDSLPDYMVPSHFVTLDAMPLTPNKKVDRKALPAPTRVEAPSNVTALVPSGNSAMQRIAAIWTRILGVVKVGPNDNFFDLGGHSLLAVQAHREIKAELGIEQLSITDIFRFPVLCALAERVETKLGGADMAKPKPAEINQNQAQTRTSAMAKRKAMRARRQGIAS